MADDKWSDMIQQLDEVIGDIQEAKDMKRIV